jgi:hypothetical protein
MWNPLRLIETLSFFGEVPLVGNVQWLQSLLGMPTPAAPLGPPLPPAPRTALLDLDHPLQQAVQDLLGTVECPLYIAPQPPTHWVNTDRVVVNVGATSHLTQMAAIVQRPAMVATPLFQFATMSPAALTSVWGAIDDGVMGGVSQSGLRLQTTDDAAFHSSYGRFSGQVSTANSGGFASVRTRNFDPPFNLQGWQGIHLQVRGDGQRYKVILRDRSGWDSVAHCASFETVRDAWTSVVVPFTAFQPTFRARTLPTAAPVQADQICSVQLMLSKFEYDGALNPQFQPGAFCLDVAEIGVYRAAPPPCLVAIAPADHAARWEQELAAAQITGQVVTTPQALIA